VVSLSTDNGRRNVRPCSPSLGDVCRNALLVFAHLWHPVGMAPNATKAIRQSGLCLMLFVAPREAKSSPRTTHPTRVTARKYARFAPLSLGGKFRYTIAKSLASSSHSSLPQSFDRGPGFGHRHVHAERGCGVADDLAHAKVTLKRTGLPSFAGAKPTYLGGLGFSMKWNLG